MRKITWILFDGCRPKSAAPTSNISEPNPDSVLYKNIVMLIKYKMDFVLKYLFSFIYELDVCDAGDALVFDECLDTERIKLFKKTID